MTTPPLDEALPAPTDARDVAVHALADIFRRRQFADDALEDLLRDSPLEGPDRRLVAQLVYSTLRHLAHIDHAIDRLARKGKESLPPAVLHVLRIALCQLLFLDRVPAYAAVDAAVEQIKRIAPGMSGLVNAMLRKAAGEPDAWRTPAPSGDDITDLALAMDHPRWLIARWLEQFGPEVCVALCEANNRQPALTARVHTPRIDRTGLLARLAADGVMAEPHPWFDDALTLPPHTVVGELPAFRAGLLVVQDLSAMLAPRLLAPAPGEIIIDACAAPGGKTSHLAALAGNEAIIYAIDRSQQRMARVKEAVKRLGLRNVRLKGGYDAAAGIPGLPKHVDAVLIDAPCSGLGTLRRRVDLRWRLRPETIPELAALQARLLDCLARKVRVGGRLVYSTCTINPEENQDVVERFLQTHRDFRLDDPRPWLPAAVRHLAGEHGYVRTFPHTDAVDGSFAARLVREKP